MSSSKLNRRQFVQGTAATTAALAAGVVPTRTVYAGNPTEDNPFGFGYKLPKRVQLEYMVVLLDDVKKQIEMPTAEDIEKYYDQNIENYKYESSELADPNDPNPEKVIKTRSFVEVATIIRETLQTQRIQTRANILFNAIKEKTEAGFETVNFDEATAEELQKAAGDFVVISEQLAQQNDIPIVTGKTGWLSMDTFSRDQVLNSLAIRRGQQYLGLLDLAFEASEEREPSRRIGIPAVRTWENIGPFSGGYYSEEESKYIQLMALVRVVGIQDTETADSVDVTFDTPGVVLDQQKAAEKTSFSLKENIKDDILLMKAMETATNRGNELAEMATETNWDDAIGAYNEKYAKTDADPNKTAVIATDDQRIELGTIEQQLRLSQAEINLTKSIMSGNPASKQRFQQWLIGSMLTNRLYTMLDEDAETTGTIQTPMAFEPEAACYVVQEVTRQPATMKDYLDNKAQTALQLSTTESIGLALVHLGPENILARMGYEPRLQQEQESAEPEQTPDDSSDEKSE